MPVSSTISPPQHIIWDWNGTLLDDTETCVQALNRCLADRSIKPVTCADYRDLFCFPVRDYYRMLGMSCSDSEWENLTAEFHQHYAELSRSTPLREGVSSILPALREKNIGMSVLSASESSLLNRMLTQRNISEHFQHICGLNNFHAHSKIEIGARLLEKINIPSDHIMLVGDTTHDFDVAMKLDCRCLLVAGGHQSNRRLNKCGCKVISRPPEILSFLNNSHYRESEQTLEGVIHEPLLP